MLYFGRSRLAEHTEGSSERESIGRFFGRADRPRIGQRRREICHGGHRDWRRSGQELGAVSDSPPLHRDLLSRGQCDHADRRRGGEEQLPGIEVGSDYDQAIGGSADGIETAYSKPDFGCAYAASFFHQIIKPVNTIATRRRLESEVRRWPGSPQMSPVWRERLKRIQR